jgi:putative oxidoreductase
VLPAIEALARLLIAALFAYSGIEKIRDMGSTAAAVTGHLPSPVPGSFAAPLGWVAAAVEIGGALMLVLGWRVRAAAVMLACFTALVTVLFHGFWGLPGGALRDAQLVQFTKNLAVLGGLLLLAVHGAGAWSVDAGPGSGRRRRRAG